MKKHYTVGFVFTPDLTQVLLVHKQKPDWQKGKRNGVGGKVEDGESIVACMARECLEETCLDIPETTWQQFAVVETNLSEIHFFATTYSGSKSDARRGDYEDVEWFSHQPLPENTLPNLDFLVPMARQKLLGNKLAGARIRYNEDHS